jgi:hypothetical protein
MAHDTVAFAPTADVIANVRDLARKLNAGRA